MTTFYAKYPASADSAATIATVQGEGTPGTPVGGVLSVQGVGGGTPVPVSGTVTATNPSVGLTGAAIPASATFVGMLVGGNLVAIVGTANGLKVDGSAVTQPVSGTVTANQGGAPWSTTISGAVTVTGTVAATQSGTWTNNSIGATSAPSPANATLVGVDVAGNLTSAKGSAAGVLVDASGATVPTKGVGLASGVLVRYAYGSGTVTTAAYTQIIASTAAAISRLYVFDSSGSAMIIATGAAASEVDKLYVPPGGTPYPFEIAITAGTRVSLKALDVNASTGQFIATGLT